MKKQNHTPTPWRTYKPDGEKWHIGAEDPSHLIIGTINGHYRTSGINQANAEFIVRAVNSHEILLEAVKFALGRFEVTSRRRPMDSLYVDTLKEAIAKAEAEL